MIVCCEKQKCFASHYHTYTGNKKRSRHKVAKIIFSTATIILRSLCFEYKKKRTKLLHQCFQLFHPSYSLLTFCQDTLRFLLRASYHRKLPQEVSIATQWQKCTGTSRIGTGRNSRTNRVSRLQIVLHSTPATGRETNTVLSLASSKFLHFANADRTSPPLYFIPRMDDGRGLSGIIPGIR